MYEVGDMLFFRLPGTAGNSWAYGTGTVADISKLDDGEHTYLLKPSKLEPHGEYHAKDNRSVVVRESEVIRRLWIYGTSFDEGDGFYVCLVTDYDIVDIAMKFEPGGLEFALRLGLLEAMQLSVGRPRALGEEINIAEVRGDSQRWIIG